MPFALVLQILQVGFVGLAFLMAFMAYRLLHAQSQKERPSPQILKANTRYMVFALLLALLAVVGQLAQSLIPANIPSDIEGRLKGLADRIDHTESRLAAGDARLAKRIGGIRLVARNAGESDPYGCGGSQRAEVNSLTVMYGIRDGTSCRVPNVNYYKEFILSVPE